MGDTLLAWALYEGHRLVWLGHNTDLRGDTDLVWVIVQRDTDPFWCTVQATQMCSRAQNTGPVEVGTEILLVPVLKIL